MREPLTKYTLREILRNGTVYPQIVFTVTAQEIAALSHEIPRKRAALVVASCDTPQTMTVRGLNGLVSEDPGFKAEKDITLAYTIFAKRAMRHGHTVTVMAWSGAPHEYEDALKDDDFVAQARYSPPDEVLSFSPRYFRKNNRQPPAKAAQKFYEHVHAKINVYEESPGGRDTLKIFSSPVRETLPYG